MYHKVWTVFRLFTLGYTVVISTTEASCLCCSVGELSPSVKADSLYAALTAPHSCSSCR